MHAAGFVHRDLKPDNLYFTNNGALKVIDFGLAKTFPTDDAPGSFLGTPGYAPPEQGIGLADVRSDIYYRLDVRVVFLIVFSFNGKRGYLEVFDHRGRDIVLRAQRIRCAHVDIGAAFL